MTDRPEHSLRDLYCISIVFLFAFMGPGALQAFLPDFYEAAGVSPAVAGARRSWVLITLYGTFLVWRVFISALIGRIGHRSAIAIGPLTYLLFAVANTFTHSYVLHLIGAAVMGFGAAAFWIASTSHILHATPANRYGLAAGLRRTALMVGICAGYALIGLLLKLDPSAEWAKWFITVTGVVALGATFLIPNRHVPVAPFSLRVFGRVAARKEILAIGFFLLGSAMSYGIILSFLRDFLKHRGEDALLLGLTLVAFPLAQGVCAFVGGAAMDRLGKTRVLQVGFAAAGLGLIGALAMTGVAGAGVLWMAVPTLLLGLQNSLVGVGGDAMAGDVVSPEHRQMAIGAMFVWRDAGVLLPLSVQLAIGGLAGQVDYGLVFGFFAGYFLVCSLLAGLAGRWLRRPASLA